MSHPVLDRVRPVVGRLANSPLYRASAAAMELFHSNVIAWVFRTHPSACTPLAHAFGIEAAEAFRVAREFRHIDLLVDSGHQALICENKVTALPDADQLRRYRDDLAATQAPVHERASYRLLSLVQPFFDLPDPWTRVSYGQLAAAVTSAASELRAGFDADFLGRYGLLCAGLDELVRAGGLLGHEDEPYFLGLDAEEELREAGVRDLVVKLRTVQLVDAVRTAAEGVRVARYEAGFSNGAPLAAYFAPAAPQEQVDDVHLGWQLQGTQMRIAVILTDEALVGRDVSRRQARETVVARHLTHWISLDRVEAAFPGRSRPTTGKLAFNHYAPDFVYRYRKLDPEITPQELVRGLARLTRDASELAVAGARSGRDRPGGA